MTITIKDGQATPATHDMMTADGDGAITGDKSAAVWLRNLGALVADLADDAATAIDRTQVAAVIQFFNGTAYDRARGDITNGLDVDVTRLPAFVQAALEAIRDRLPAALVGGRLDVNVGAASVIVDSLTAIYTRLGEIRDNALVTTPISLAIASADTELNAFPSQAVKTPVHISIRKGTAPVTINDGSGTDSILEWDDTNGHHTFQKVFYVANLNQLSYQFSANDGSQVIEVQAGN